MSSERIINELRDEFIDVYSILYENEYIKEHNDFSENRIGDSIYELTWSGKSEKSTVTFRKNLEFDKIIYELLKHGQYSLMFYDRSIALIEYTIEEGNIIKQRYQYLNKINNIKSRKDILDIETKEEALDVEGPGWFETTKGIPLYIRLDYDPMNNQEIIHSDSHMTLANIKNCRIPLKSNIMLKEFILFIMRHIYGDYKINFGSISDAKRLLTPKEKNHFHINWKSTELYNL